MEVVSCHVAFGPSPAGSANPPRPMASRVLPGYTLGCVSRDYTNPTVWLRYFYRGINDARQGDRTFPAIIPGFGLPRLPISPGPARRSECGPVDDDLARLYVSRY